MATTSRRANAVAPGRFGGGRLTVAKVQSTPPFELVDAMRGLSMDALELLDEQEAQALVAACERVATAVQARASLAMETLACRVQERLDAESEEFAAAIGARSVGVSSSHQVVPSMLAPALRLATSTVLTRLEADRFLVNTMALTFQAVWDGDLERHRADVVTECGRGLPSRVLERYEELVLETSVDESTGVVREISPRVKEMSRANLRRRAARIARDLEPQATRMWAKRAHAERRVTVRGADAPGMTRWEAFLPAEVSTRMWNAVDALASTYCRNTAGLAVDAARADALADLVLANSTVRTTAELLVPVLPSAADGSAPTTWMVAGPLEDTRVGTLLPETAAALLADPDILVRLSRLDPDGGVVQDPRSYRPGSALRRRVRSRDRTCRFPGCNTPAARCDLDHVVPYPHGPTHETNLMCVCRTHHLFKHHGGWRSRLSLDGTVTWRAPDGRTYITRPGTRHLVDDLLKVTGDGTRGDPQVRWSGPSLAQLVVEEPVGLHRAVEHVDVPQPPADWSVLPEPNWAEEAEPDWAEGAEPDPAGSDERDATEPDGRDNPDLYTASEADGSVMSESAGSVRSESDGSVRSESGSSWERHLARMVRICSEDSGICAAGPALKPGLLAWEHSFPVDDLIYELCA